MSSAALTRAQTEAESKLSEGRKQAPRAARAPSPHYTYTDRDGMGRVDKAIKAYGSPWVGQTCERAGPWWRGKAVMRFPCGTLVCVRTRLLRRVR